MTYTGGIKQMDDSKLPQQPSQMKNKIFKEYSPTTIENYSNSKSGYQSQEAIRKSRSNSNSFGTTTIPPKSNVKKRKYEVLRNEKDLDLDNLDEDEDEDGMDNNNMVELSQTEPPSKKRKINAGLISSRTRRKVSFAPDVKQTDGVPGAYFSHLCTLRKRNKYKYVSLPSNDSFVGFYTCLKNYQLNIINNNQNKQLRKQQEDQYDDDDDDNDEKDIIDSKSNTNSKHEMDDDDNDDQVQISKENNRKISS